MPSQTSAVSEDKTRNHEYVKTACDVLATHNHGATQMLAFL